MQIKVLFRDKDKKIEMDEKKKIEDLLNKIKVNPETVVIKLNGKIVPEEDKLKDGDKLELIDFVSSG